MTSGGPIQTRRGPLGELTTDTAAVDLTNCDREPIHIPGSIQPHGCLLACDAEARFVLRRSANVADLLGTGPDPIGLPLDAVIGAQIAHDARNSVAQVAVPGRAGLMLGRTLPGGRVVDLSVHQHGGATIIEIEPHQDGADHPLELARALVGRMRQLSTTNELLARAPRFIRGMLGYDRVMIYRFDADGSGEVISEARRGNLESFMGQHFPAADIPQQARRLYLQNTIRIVSDASGASAAIEPVLDASGEPLDLSHAHLRSVSPIHCEYLRNMGVGASMSISLIIGGRLWGLVACHHYSPRVLSAGLRMAAEMFGEFLSLHLESAAHRERLDRAARATQVLDGLMRDATRSDDLGDVLMSHLAELGSLIRFDGAGLWLDGTWQSTGLAPPPTAIPALMRMCETAADGQVFATHALSQRLPTAADYAHDVAGLLAIPLSQRPRDYLVLFRCEVIRTVDWAGDPTKTYGTGPLGDRLTPRRSFAIWKQTVERQSLAWSVADREVAEAARQLLVEVVLRHSEALDEERSKAATRMRMLNEELNHRVKNILSLIKSLVSQRIEPGRSIEDYVVSLKGRIQALAFAHDQVVRGAGGGSLRALLEAELSPYRQARGNVTLSGPPVILDARAFSVMALVLHELATNAAKYGSLSRPQGNLEVVWTLHEDGSCTLRWVEALGPLVTPPSRIGLGTVLLDRSIPHDLGGSATVSYLPSGVEATFVLPPRHILSGEVETPVAATLAGVREAADASPIAGLRVLLVEDQLMIALDTETMLTECGATSVETSGTTSEALKEIEAWRPDLALLDVNLGAEYSFPVASALTERGVPFIFATGYGESSLIPGEFGSVPVLRKPFDAEGLRAAVENVLRGPTSP